MSEKIPQENLPYKSEIEHALVEEIETLNLDARQKGDILLTTSVFIYCIDKSNSENSFYLPVSKESKIGYMTYDTTKYISDDNQTHRKNT